MSREEDRIRYGQIAQKLKEMRRWVDATFNSWVDGNRVDAKNTLDRALGLAVRIKEQIAEDEQ